MDKPELTRIDGLLHESRIEWHREACEYCDFPHFHTEVSTNTERVMVRLICAGCGHATYPELDFIGSDDDG